jgi:hypothetical protein
VVVVRVLAAGSPRHTVLNAMIVPVLTMWNWALFVVVAVAIAIGLLAVYEHGRKL